MPLTPNFYIYSQNIMFRKITTDKYIHTGCNPAQIMTVIHVEIAQKLENNEIFANFDASLINDDNKQTTLNPTNNTNSCIFFDLTPINFKKSSLPTLAHVVIHFAAELIYADYVVIKKRIYFE